MKINIFNAFFMLEDHNETNIDLQGEDSYMWVGLVGVQCIEKKIEKKQTKDMNCQKIYDLGDFDAHF